MSQLAQRSDTVKASTNDFHNHLKNFIIDMAKKIETTGSMMIVSKQPQRVQAHTMSCHRKGEFGKTNRSVN